MRIVDCYSEVLAFVYRSARAMPEDYDSFRQQVERMLTQGSSAAGQRDSMMLNVSRQCLPFAPGLTR